MGSADLCFYLGGDGCAVSDSLGQLQSDLAAGSVIIGTRFTFRIVPHERNPKIRPGAGQKKMLLRDAQIPL